MSKVIGFSYLPYLIQYVILFLMGFFVFTLGTLSYEGYMVLNPTILTEIVPREGGTLVVTNDYTSLTDLTVEIQPFTYTRDTTISVSEYDIDQYNLPNNVQPISPLIVLEDEFDIYTSLPVSVTVPISIDSSSEFAMGFYYLEDGTLEAIPIEELTDTSITIKSLSYQPFFISSITRSVLVEASTEGNSITTGFEPGEDDWPFANYGSALEINGHCAGQSLSSMYYYLTQTKNGQEPLYTYADMDTPEFWLDDRDGYRFASVIQHNISFTSQAFISFTDNSSDADYLSYYGFLYAMYVTGNPQFMAIYAHTNGIVYSGHALLAYKAEGGNIYVSDPNFPAAEDRFISYTASSGYGTYSSGDNATNISQQLTISYDTFAFVGLSSFVDFDILEEQYNRFENGTIGQFLMPTLSSTTSLDDQDNLVLDIAIDSTQIIYTIFIDHELYRSNITNQSTMNLEVVIPLSDITGDIGILAEEVIGTNTYYADYETIRYPLE